MAAAVSLPNSTVLLHFAGRPASNARSHTGNPVHAAMAAPLTSNAYTAGKGAFLAAGSYKSPGIPQRAPRLAAMAQAAPSFQVCACFFASQSAICACAEPLGAPTCPNRRPGMPTAATGLLQPAAGAGEGRWHGQLRRRLPRLRGRLPQAG